jgi:hypothetical protein
VAHIEFPKDPGLLHRLRHGEHYSGFARLTPLLLGGSVPETLWG